MQNVILGSAQAAVYPSPLSTTDPATPDMGFHRPGLVKRYTSPVDPQAYEVQRSGSPSRHPSPPIDRKSTPSLGPTRQVLRKASHPGLASGMSLHKNRKNHHALHLSISPPSSASFHPFDDDAPVPPYRHPGSPPSSAKSSGFAIDQSRTRKHSFASPSPMWSEILPSIQGMLGDAGPKTPKAGTFGFGRRGSRSPDKRQGGDWPGSAGNGDAHDMLKKDSGDRKKTSSRRAKRDSLRLPIMAPLLSPPPMTPRSFSSPDVSPAAASHAIYGQRSTRSDGHTQLDLSTSSNFGHGYADHSSRSTTEIRGDPDHDASPFTHDYTIVSHGRRRPSDRSEQVDDGWDFVSLAPSASSSTIADRLDAKHAASPPHRTRHPRPTKLYVDPEVASFSDEVDLRACEVLEHLESHLLSSGWGDAVYRQHEQYISSTVSLVSTAKKDKETRSMRSWRDGRRNRSKTLQRPLSEQAPPPSIAAQVKASLARQESNPKGRAAGPPVVPPRHASRPAGVPLKKSPETGDHSATEARLSVRQKEKSSRPPLVTDAEAGRELKDVNPSSMLPNDLPFHLRPLPPVPDIVPSKSSFLPNKLQNRLLRTKRPSTAPSILRPVSPMGGADVPSPMSPARSGKQVSAAGITSPRTHARLIPRDEPPAALGKRSDDVADRRNGMTAMSFLVLNDPKSRTASAKTSTASISGRQPVTGLPDNSPKNSFDRSDEVAGTDVVAHIIPPKELSMIAHQRTQAAADRTGTSTDADADLAGAHKSEEPTELVAGPHVLCRPRGPVVPPRKAIPRSTSLGPADVVSPTSLSPPPPRLHKSSGPDSGSPWTCRAGPSALTLPTNDRPSTMGGGDSPIMSTRLDTPESPSSIGGDGLGALDGQRSAASHTTGTSPVVMLDDGEFGTRTGSNSTTGSHYGPLDEGDEPASTPRSLRAAGEGAAVRIERSEVPEELPLRPPRSHRVDERSRGNETDGKQDPTQAHLERPGLGQHRDSHNSSAKASPVSLFSLTTPTNESTPFDLENRGDVDRQIPNKHPFMRHMSHDDHAASSKHHDRIGDGRHRVLDGNVSQDADSLSLDEREILERAQAREALRVWLGSKPRRG